MKSLCLFRLSHEPHLAIPINKSAHRINEQQNLTIRIQNASDNQIDECIPEEIGKLASGVCFVFRILQPCRVHQKLRITPAKGPTNHAGSIAELLTNDSK
jgi:hypothetical protein